MYQNLEKTLQYTTINRTRNEELEEINQIYSNKALKLGNKSIALTFTIGTITTLTNYLEANRQINIPSIINIVGGIGIASSLIGGLARSYHLNRKKDTTINNTNNKYNQKIKQLS